MSLPQINVMPSEVPSSRTIDYSSHSKGSRRGSYGLGMSRIMKAANLDLASRDAFGLLNPDGDTTMLEPIGGRNLHIKK